ncbi:MAG TPA: MarR family transcriptional regulator [Pseudonocardia sp.]|nr:MarR family transcriptional regulator [Pseudonocardia sp.]
MTDLEAAGQVPIDELVHLSFLVQQVLGEASARHELSIIQTRVLGILRDREPGMQELARLLGTDKSSASGLVNRAERRGLVQRRIPDQDRRSVLISITDEGQRVIAAVSVEVGEKLRELLSGLPAGDQASLARLLARVIELADAETAATGVRTPPSTAIR